MLLSYLPLHNSGYMVTSRLSDAAATLSYLTSRVCDLWNAVRSSTQYANFMGHVFGILKFTVTIVRHFFGYCQKRLGTEIKVSVIGVLVGRDCDSLRANRSGDRIPVEARFSAHV
jgi:hypothetical protein